MINIKSTNRVSEDNLKGNISSLAPKRENKIAMITQINYLLKCTALTQYLRIFPNLIL